MLVVFFTLDPREVRVHSDHGLRRSFFPKKLPEVAAVFSCLHFKGFKTVGLTHHSRHDCWQRCQFCIGSSVAQPESQRF